MITTDLKLITFPARPVNGGPFDKAPPKSGEWLYEPKYNGWRALVHVPTGSLFNRHGQSLSIGEEFVDAILELQRINDAVCRIEWLDCEALERRHRIGQGCLVVLDLIDEASQPCRVRRELLHDLFPEPASLRPATAKFPLLSVPPAVFADTAWHDLQRINREIGCPFYEGLVAKRADSTYPIQHRSPHETFPFWVKHRWAF